MEISGEQTLHVESDGSGLTLVLGHGFGGSARNFRAQTRALAGRYRVVRFDARGHARSTAPTDPAAYKPEAFVADLGRILDHVGAERAVLGGLSMGAGIALRFALAHPARTQALVLASFPTGAGVPGTYTAVAHRFADTIERDGLEAAGAVFVWGPESGLDARAAKLVRAGFLEHTPHGVAHTLRGLIARQPATAEIVPRLGAVTQPVLLIAGDRDRPSLDASRALAAALPRATLVVVEGAGHLVNLAKPAEFNAAVDTFLREIA